MGRRKRSKKRQNWILYPTHNVRGQSPWLRLHTKDRVNPSLLRDLLSRLLRYLFRPKPIEKLTLTIRRSNDMKQAVVHFEWTKSPSADVVKQTLSVKVAEAEPVVVELEATVEQWGPVTVPESAAVHVELVANDGTYDSAPAVLDFVLGDLTVPEPPTSLTYKIDEVVDVPETPAEPAPETPEPEVPAPEAPAPEAPAPEAPAPEAPVA